MFTARFSYRKPTVLLFIFIVVALFGCRKKTVVFADEEFSQYIHAYTSGIISKKSVFRIQLAADAPSPHSVNETIQEPLFSFSPSVKGNAYWADARTIEFKPAEDLTPNELYTAEFNLGKVIEVPSKFKIFNFSAEVIKPSFQVEEDGLQSTDEITMTFSGKVTTADVEDSKIVEKLVAVSYDNKNATLLWQHNEENREHRFFAEGIQRKKTAGKLLLKWSGDALNAPINDQREIEIPAIGDFKVTRVRAMQDNGQYVLVQFSEPLLARQPFEGLVAWSGVDNLSYSVNGCELKIFTDKALDESYTLTIYEGIENLWRRKLNKSFTASVVFENLLPSVKIHGKGVILPAADGKLILPFEAVNLKAVDISIIKIYENNMAAFLHSGNIASHSNLREFARPLAQATIKLEGERLDLHKKNKFFLDLGKYIKAEPGAIYRTIIAFRQDYSLYSCTDNAASYSKNEDNEDEDEEEEEEGDYRRQNSLDDDESFWSYYDSSYPRGYKWSQRDNPCHKSYYRKQNFAVRNILATNIGLTAKAGLKNKLLVAVTHLITAEPLGNTELQVFDYQNQLVGSGKSDGDGMVEIALARKPYLLIAKNGNERSYLKIDDGSSLPVSQFDVAGAGVKNGIKGFIFGERGVWRPGDSLFISCLIEDKNKTLPAEHPVEMELISPKGQLYKRVTALNNPDGFNVFRTAVDVGAPTGNWLCRVKLGGSVFEKTLKIETIIPNRLKINLDFGEAKALGKGAKINGKLSAKWLFGAAAQNLKAKVDVQLYKRTAAFGKFKDFIFENPVAAFSPLSETIFDGSLDANGTASVNPSFEVRGEAPGMLSANLSTKVFEPGGNFSVDNVAMPYHPYASYAGVKVPQSETTQGYQYIANRKNQTFQLANVNTDGAPVEGRAVLEVSLYRIHWSWWQDDTGDDISNYTNSEYSKLIKTESIALNKGRGNFVFKFDDDYGRYLILAHDKNSGHKAGQIFYVDSDGWRSRMTGATAASMLAIVSAKEKYSVGENVELHIPSSKQGKALISIESGSKVIKTYWTDTQEGMTKFSFKAEKEMTPTIYVNVSLIQPHAQTINDLPIRMYGILPLAIEDKEAILNPVIAMNDVIRPEEKASIAVSEQNKKPFTYVIAIVDEGLLDLTRFKTPDPHSVFFAKEALGVKSWDLYDYVIGAWGGELERILTVGGDEGKADAGKGAKANRFKPVVKFLGPFKSSGGVAVHRFVLPSYMGSVRAMVIASGNNAYGFAEKTVAVKKPLMLLTTLPRMLGPGEEVTIPVTVFATDNSIKNVQVSIQSNPLVETSGSSKISFSGLGEQTVFLKAKVKNNIGVGKIKVIASSGGASAFSETELDVRNPNPFATKVTEAVLPGGQTFADHINKIGDEASSKAMIEISSIPAINLQKRLSYLIQYPHGCIEQTTSSVFPQLVLDEITELDDRSKAGIERNVRAGIQRIQNFQTVDGGFSYWPGYTESDEWGTNYAGNFLLEAMSRGYNVPSTMTQQWKKYTRKKALEWNMTEYPEYGSDLTQAYRLYLLALAKSPEMGAMNRLKENKFITPEAKWRLAAAYHLAGQAQTAVELIDKLPVKFSVRTSWGISYGSELRDEAMVLETLAVMKKTSEAEELMRTIAAKLSQEDWYSTQTTAYSLIAIARYSNFSSDKKIDALVSNQGNTVTVKTKNSVSQTAVVWKNGKSDISVKNNGSNLLYIRVINQGQPIGGESISLANNPSVLLVNVDYLDAKGKSIDVARLKQGTDFVAKVTVKNPGHRGSYTEMALTQIFPGGWEIINTRLYNNEGAFKSSESNYMDIRDDRVYHYFNLKSNETRTYYVQLNAAYLGKYYFPGVYCEAMYDHAISGGNGGRWVEVNG